MSKAGNEMAQLMANLQDTFAALNEGVVGYRAARLAEGFNESEAAAMAVAYHGAILAIIAHNLTKGPK